MKNQIHASSRFEALGGKARPIICQRVGARPGLLRAHLLAHQVRLLATFGFLVALFGPSPVRAAVTEAWVHRYNNVVSNSTDQAYAVVSDAAGDFIVTGSTDEGTNGRDMLTIKYSGADGSVLWQRRYNGPANDDDQASTLAVDGSGNVVVTGTSVGSASGSDYYTAKYAAADGALLWEQRYNGPGKGNDVARAVAVDVSGNVVVTGSSDNFNFSNTDYYTAKYAAADGALLWEKRYNGPANLDDVASAAAVDGSGNVVVTGYSGATIDDPFNYYTAKYAAADGALLWERRYNGLAGTPSWDFSQGLALDANGNVVMMGSSYTAKYAAANGALLWEKRDIGARAVAVDGSGNVVVTGSSNRGTYTADFYTAKYAAADGALLWEKPYNGPVKDPNNWEEGRAVAVDGSGNVVVARLSGWGNLMGSSFDFYTAKYAASDGALLWEKRYDGAYNENWYVPAVAVAVDSSGNVVLTGAPFSSESDTDYYTAKYAAADGALLWEKRYNDLANREDSARAVAVDGSGNVVVTGSSISSARNADFYTAKYAAANGALLWEKRYNGSAYSESAKAMALDGSGNVAVTLATRGGFYTAKYAAADGALLWEKRGPGGGASAMAVDGRGNVVVTGSSEGYYYTAKYAAMDGARLWEERGPNGGASAVAIDDSGNVVLTGSSNAGNNFFNPHYYTVKYAAADGALLWEKRYNGPANINDSAGAVAVDGTGNVVVTGTSYNGNNNDYYTAKYAAADGTLLWEKRYNGRANSEDSAQAVAVDGSGNVVVTGSSYSGTNTDFYTAKYAAADGTLLWEKRYNGPDSTDQAQAVAVDNRGNVVVTGSSVSSEGGWDYYTAKYAAADGALVWEIRYNQGNDFVSSLALGPNGIVAITGSSGGDYATVVYRETLPPLAIERVPTGVRLRFTGVPGSSYTIERAPTVTGPWTTINKQTASASGLIEYVDTKAPAGTAFYLTAQP